MCTKGELLERDREMLWKVRYSVSDPNNYILLGRDPSTTHLRVTPKSLRYRDLLCKSKKTNTSKIEKER